jgi:hypothetical protein
MQEGERQAARDIIKNSLKAGLPIQTIEKITGVPAEEINRLKQEMETDSQL